MDMDTTIKGIPINQDEIEKILNKIILIDLDDHINFKIKNIKNIHDVSEYDDFRVSLEAIFYTIKVNLKIDITTGDVIIPGEVDYSYNLMFEDRKIMIKAYNLNTILAEKIESILVRNVSNYNEPMDSDKVFKIQVNLLSKKAVKSARKQAVQIDTCSH